MKYLTIAKNKDMGLNNEICIDKQFFCKSHKVFLSKEDVDKKSCLKKWSFDMLEQKRCYNLIEYNERTKKEIHKYLKK